MPVSGPVAEEPVADSKWPSSWGALGQLEWWGRWILFHQVNRSCGRGLA